MKLRRSHLKLLALAATCVAIGGAVSAIATAGAAPSSSGHHAKGAALATHGRLARIFRRTVHGSFIVRTKSGFATATVDRGTVVSVSGRQLTLREGTRTTAYKTVTLTIPATARVRDDRSRASLSQVRAGQRATVLALPKRTVVIARTAKSA